MLKSGKIRLRDPCSCAMLPPLVNTICTSARTHTRLPRAFSPSGKSLGRGRWLLLTATLLAVAGTVLGQEPVTTPIDPTPVTTPRLPRPTPVPPIGGGGGTTPPPPACPITPYGPGGTNTDRGVGQRGRGIQFSAGANDARAGLRKGYDRSTTVPVIIRGRGQRIELRQPTVGGGGVPTPGGALVPANPNAPTPAVN